MTMQVSGAVTSLFRDRRRRLLLEASAAPLDETVYLWRNFATTGARSNEHEVYVPMHGGRYAVYTFKDYIASSGGALYFGRMKEGLPVVNLASNDASVTKVGTWAASANAAAYNGTSLQSSTAGDTMTATVTGHTLILRAFVTTNGGFGTVAIDGDFTAANRLPAVTQTEVDAGYFASGDIGKRYIECYSANVYEDEHFVLAEGLSDAAHTVQVRVQGTKRAASTATRVYVAGFASATAGTKVTDANASMGYVRDVTNLRSGNTFSKMTLAPEFSPTGFTNYQYMGGNHGNETLVSQQFLVDNVVSAPAAGVYVSGREVQSLLVSNLTHPSTGATVVAAKRGNYVARGDRDGTLAYRFQLVWKNAGTARNSYYGMLHLGRRPYPTATLENPDFPRFLVGNTPVLNPTANNESAQGLTAADVVAAYSSAHDTVAVVHLPRLDLSVDAFSRAGTGAFVQDRSDGTEKVYFARSSTLQTEAIAAGTLHAGEIRWRLLRIPSAATRLETAGV